MLNFKKSSEVFNELPPIKAIRLISGEIVMGFYQLLKNGNHRLIDVKQCMVNVNSENNQMNVNLADNIPFAKSFDFEFHRDQVVNVFEVKPQLETNYKVATGNNNLEKRALQGGQVRGLK